MAPGMWAGKAIPGALSFRGLAVRLETRDRLVRHIHPYRSTAWPNVWRTHARYTPDGPRCLVDRRRAPSHDFGGRVIATGACRSCGAGAEAPSVFAWRTCRSFEGWERRLSRRSLGMVT